MHRTPSVWEFPGIPKKGPFSRREFQWEFQRFPTFGIPANLHHTFRHHITTSSLFRRLNLLDIDSYNHNRLLRWTGHVARMPMSRAPRQLLTSWVAHSRPGGCPQMAEVETADSLQTKTS